MRRQGKRIRSPCSERRTGSDPKPGADHVSKRGLSLVLVALFGCATVHPPDQPSFGVLGDTPYSELEAERLDVVIAEINREALAFVVHVGDIGQSSAAQGCGDEWLAQRRVQFARIRHPFVLVPGDNEWSECRDPLARLKKWRALFCNTRLKVDVQPGEYCEHMRWEAGERVFVTLNIPGNNNNAAHPEHAPRMRAVFAWLDEAVAAARGRGLVILMQANPFVPGSGYAELRSRIGDLGRRFAGNVLVVHGDTHIYKSDEPLPGVRRVEVWGSPFVAWTRLPL